MAFKIYTKTGDKGQTSILGGQRLPKHHMRITSYGEVDELNSWIGVIRDGANSEVLVDFLIEIQTNLLVNIFATTLCTLLINPSTR